MGRSLRARLFVAQALLVAAVLLIVTSFAIVEQRRWVLDWHAERLERAARAVKAELPPTGAFDPVGRAQGLGRLLGLRVTLIDVSGRVRGDSDVPRERLSGVENHASRPEVAAALAGRVGRATRLSATVGSPFLYVAIPGRDSGLAVVRVAERVAEISGLNRTLVGLSVASAAAALLAALPLALWVARAQAGRTRELETVTARIGAGDVGARARELPADELGRLGGAINRMAGELRARLEALERERDERERILAHMTDGVVLLDRDGRVVHANQSLARILGMSLPPSPGTPFQAFARAPELEELVREARSGANAIERDLQLWAPRQRLVRATATRLRGSGEGTAMLVLHDLTELDRLSRVRQDFVANVSHELKTPLTSVRGYAETLLEGGLEDTAHRAGFVQVIRDQARRLQVLVEDLLSLAELERPDAQLRPEPFDLREAADRQVRQFLERAREAGIDLALEPGSGVPVIADRGRIDQVLANLLDNALKYTERGSIRVAVGHGEGRAWCEVSDTGAGIAPEHQARVFERFYRVDPARSRERGGTGLGLSIVKHILELHGGAVAVRSAPGAGSTFRFELPAAGRGA